MLSEKKILLAKFAPKTTTTTNNQQNLLQALIKDKFV